jgi:hypothetical protein
VKSVSSICKGILAAAVVLASMSLWAESKGALELQHPTAVAGKTLATGNYVVRWEGTGDQVELKIYSGKNVVASLPARVIQLSSPAGNNSAVINQSSSGTPSLAEIRFGGKKFALRLNNEGSGSGSAGASR